MLLAYIESNRVHFRSVTYPASEGLATFGADEGCGNKVGIVVTFEVHVQQLLLSEGLFTLAAGVWFLSGMGSTMHHHVALLAPTA